MGRDWMILVPNALEVEQDTVIVEVTACSSMKLDSSLSSLVISFVLPFTLCSRYLHGSSTSTKYRLRRPGLDS